MRRSIALLVAFLAISGLVGCGKGSPAPTTAAAPTGATTTPAGAPGSVSASSGSTVPLRITPAQLEARIGTPASPLRDFPDGFRCSLYRISEQPPFVKLRFCFRHGRLEFLSTYAVATSP